MPVNEITASKAEYALALTALGLKVSNYIPERVVPPVVIIGPGSPYLTPVTLDGELTMNLELMVVAAPAVQAPNVDSILFSEVKPSRDKVVLVAITPAILVSFTISIISNNCSSVKSGAIFNRIGFPFDKLRVTAF